jgi:uncharacterized protein (TIGR02217 family)
MANGRERRNADWDQPRYSFILPLSNISEEIYRNLLRMFLNVRGQNDGFLYFNHLDNKAVDELAAFGEAGQTEVQLGKVSIIDGVPYQMLVHALYLPDGDTGEALESEISITLDGTPTTAFSINPDNGKVTFDSPLSGGEEIRWSGFFSHWVRFNSDQLAMTINSRRSEGFAISGQVELVEIAAPQVQDSSG